MPMEQHGIADRLAIAAEEIRHEFCSARLGGIGAAVVGLKSQVLRDGRLHARAIEDLSLNCRAIDSLLCHEFDRKVLTIVGIEVGHDTDQNTGTLQKLVFTASQSRRVIGEVGPVGLLPVPTHDR